MTVRAAVALPVSVPEAFAALEDERFIARCAHEVFDQPVRGDGVLRGRHTHVQGDNATVYQITTSVTETDADQGRIAYQIRAREERGGSLATMALVAELSAASEGTVLGLTSKLVLAGGHGGQSYADLDVDATRAVDALGARIADLLGDPQVRAVLASAENRPDTGLTPTAKRTIRVALAMAAAGLVAVAASSYVRRALTRCQRLTSQ